MKKTLLLLPLLTFSLGLASCTNSENDNGEWYTIEADKQLLVYCGSSSFAYYSNNYDELSYFISTNGNCLDLKVKYNYTSKTETKIDYFYGNDISYVLRNS